MYAWRNWVKTKSQYQMIHVIIFEADDNVEIRKQKQRE